MQEELIAYHILNTFITPVITFEAQVNKVNRSLSHSVIITVSTYATRQEGHVMQRRNFCHG